MRSRESLIRLHRFQVDEKRRTVTDIEAMVADFRQKETELDQQIEAEQQRSGITDINHFAYPTFAKAAIKRRDNLLVSIENLSKQLDAATQDLEEAEAELKKYELLVEKEEDRQRSDVMPREPAEFDEVSLGVYQREPSRR
jgi:flagellar export protein FliJ